MNIKEQINTLRLSGNRIHQEAADTLENLYAALIEIADQKTSEELDGSGERFGDYEEGFDMCVIRARAVVQESEK